jgi:hypothetical protein
LESNNETITGGEKNLVFSNNRNPSAIPKVANMNMVYNKAVFGFSLLPSYAVLTLELMTLK